MTMPPLMNCQHLPDGVCLQCVGEMIVAEREACAKLVDVKQGVEAWEIHGGQETIDVLRDLAAAIRARSN